MKTEDLKEIGLSDEQIPRVMAELGKDVQREQDKAAKNAEALKSRIEALNDRIKEFDEKIKASADIDSKSKAEIAKIQSEHAKALKEIENKYKAENVKVTREAETKSFLSGLGRGFVNEMTAAHYENALNEAVADPANAGRSREEIFESLIKDGGGKERADIFAGANPLNLPPAGPLPPAPPPRSIPKII